MFNYLLKRSLLNMHYDDGLVGGVSNFMITKDPQIRWSFCQGPPSQNKYLSIYINE